MILRTEYKKGGEFLLFLQLANGKFKTHFRSLAPVNEQIRGKNDAWVVWVREQIGNLSIRELFPRFGI